MPRSFDPYTPIVIVRIDGRELTLKGNAQVEEFEFDDLADGDDQITLTISDPTGELVDDPRFQARKEIEVSWGYPGLLSPVHKGILLEPEVHFGESTTINLVALDKGSKLHGRAEQKVWKNIKYCDIARAIAERHSLRAIVQETYRQFESLPQGNRSDYEFMVFLASEEKFEFYIDGEELHFHEKMKIRPPLETFVWFSGMEKTLLEFHPRYNTQEIKDEAETTAVGFDPETREPVIHIANAETKKTPGFGRKTLQVNLANGDTKYSETETGHVAATPHQKLDEVEKEAEAKRAEAEEKQVVATAKVIGIPYIRTQRTIVIQGVGDRFSGRWDVTRANHRIGSEGYVLRLELQRDAVEEEENAGPQGKALAPIEPEDPETERVYHIDVGTGEVQPE